VEPIEVVAEAELIDAELEPMEAVQTGHAFLFSIQCFVEEGAVVVGVEEGEEVERSQLDQQY
jgi:hypothetical protein